MTNGGRRKRRRRDTLNWHQLPNLLLESKQPHVYELHVYTDARLLRKCLAYTFFCSLFFQAAAAVLLRASFPRRRRLEEEASSIEGQWSQACGLRVAILYNDINVRKDCIRVYPVSTFCERSCCKYGFGIVGISVASAV